MGNNPEHEVHSLEGRCLCGAVTVCAQVQELSLTACHCDMCRRHTSSFFLGLTPVQDKLIVEGPAKSYRSSDWAERGFCETCGSTLWYGTVQDGARYIAAGLFENAGGASIGVEYFSDKCPQGYGVAGDHRRMTEAETIASFADAETEGQRNE